MNNSFERKTTKNITKSKLSSSLTLFSKPTYQVRYLTDDLLLKIIAKQGHNNFSSVKALDLRAVSKNEKFQVIENLERFLNLQVLNFADNAISRIENLGALTNLISLDLSGNNITKIDGLEHLTNLQVLKLSKNLIARLPDQRAFVNLKALRELRLDNNKLSVLGDVKELRVLDSLSTLIVEQNPLCSTEYHRLFIIFHLSSLNVLDNVPISSNEREEARVRFAIEEVSLLEREVNTKSKKISTLTENLTTTSNELQKGKSLVTKLQDENESLHKTQLKLSDELKSKNKLLDRKSAALNKACSALYALQQQVEFYRIENPEADLNLDDIFSILPQVTNPLSSIEEDDLEDAEDIDLEQKLDTQLANLQASLEKVDAQLQSTLGQEIALLVAKDEILKNIDSINTQLATLKPGGSSGEIILDDSEYESLSKQAEDLKAKIQEKNSEIDELIQFIHTSDEQEKSTLEKKVSQARSDVRSFELQLAATRHKLASLMDASNNSLSLSSSNISTTKKMVSLQAKLKDLTSENEKLEENLKSNAALAGNINELRAQLISKINFVASQKQKVKGLYTATNPWQLVLSTMLECNPQDKEALEASKLPNDDIEAFVKRKVIQWCTVGHQEPFIDLSDGTTQTEDDEEEEKIEGLELQFAIVSDEKRRLEKVLQQMRDNLESVSQKHVEAERAVTDLNIENEKMKLQIALLREAQENQEAQPSRPVEAGNEKEVVEKLLYQMKELTDELNAIRLEKQRLQEAVTDSEIQLKHLKHLEGVVPDLQQRVKSLIEEKVVLEGQVADLTSIQTELQEQVDNDQEMIKALRTNISAASSEQQLERTELEKTLKSLQHQIKEYQLQFEEFNIEKQKLALDIEKKDVQIGELIQTNSNIERLTAEESQLSLHQAALVKQIETLQKTFATKQHELNLISQQISTLSSTRESIGEEIQEMEDKLRSNRMELNQVLSHIGEKSSELHEVKQVLSKEQDACESVQSRLKQANKDLSLAEQEKDTLNRRCSELKDDLSQMSEERKKLQKLIDELQNETENEKDLLERTRRETAAASRDSEQVQQELRNAKAELLSVQQTLNKLIPDKQDLEKQLSDWKLQYNSLKQQAEALQRDNNLLNSQVTDLRSERAALEISVKDLALQVEDSQKRNESVLKQLENSSQQYRALQQQLRQLQANKISLLEDNKNIKEQTQTLEKSAATLVRLIERAKVEIQETTNQKEKMAKDVVFAKEKLEKEKETSMEMIRELQTELNSLEIQKVELDSDLKSMDTERTALLAELDKTRNDLSNIEFSVKSKQNEFKLVESQYDFRKEQLRVLEHSLHMLQCQKEEMELRVQQSEDILDPLQRVNSGIMARIHQLEKEKQDLIEQNKEWKNRVSELNRVIENPEIRNNFEQDQQLKKDLQEKQQELQELKYQFENLKLAHHSLLEAGSMGDRVLPRQLFSLYEKELRRLSQSLVAEMEANKENALKTQEIFDQKEQDYMSLIKKLEETVREQQEQHAKFAKLLEYKHSTGEQPKDGLASLLQQQAEAIHKLRSEVVNFKLQSSSLKENENKVALLRTQVSALKSHISNIEKVHQKELSEIRKAILESIESAEDINLSLPLTTPPKRDETHLSVFSNFPVSNPQPSGLENLSILAPATPKMTLDAGVATTPHLKHQHREVRNLTPISTIKDKKQRITVFLEWVKFTKDVGRNSKQLMDDIMTDEGLLPASKKLKLNRLLGKFVKDKKEPTVTNMTTTNKQVPTRDNSTKEAVDYKKLSKEVEKLRSLVNQQSNFLETVTKKKTNNT